MNHDDPADDFAYDAAKADAQATGGRGGLFQDSVRKVLVGGASALLMGEEGLRSAFEARLPKEALSFVLQQTDKTRREVTRLVSKEVKGALRKVDLRRELRRTLLGLKVDVRATVRFREDVEGDPQVQLRTRVRRRRRKARDAAAAAAAGATGTAAPATPAASAGEPSAPVAASTDPHVAATPGPAADVLPLDDATPRGGHG